MSDYAKTVKQLRYCSKATMKDCMECEGYKETGDCTSEKLAKEAATAIEELMAQVKDKDYLIQQQIEEIERLQRDVKKQQEKMIELAKGQPHWVSVEDPPKDKQECFVAYKGPLGFIYDHGIFYDDLNSGLYEDIFEDGTSGFVLDGDVGYALGSIDYWMPIEPPQEVQE